MSETPEEKRQEDNNPFAPDMDSPAARADNPDVDATVDEEENLPREGDELVSQFDPKAGLGPAVESDSEDKGNHEADVVEEPPTLNDEGELVDSSGKKVFTTVEESLKDGSMVLDAQNRMPGVYLQDLEHEARLRHGARVEQAFESARESGPSYAARSVSVASSPIPDVTINSKPTNGEDTMREVAPAALMSAPDMPASEEQITRNT